MLSGWSSLHAPPIPLGSMWCDLKHNFAVWQRYALNGADVLGQPAAPPLHTTAIRSCIARAPATRRSRVGALPAASRCVVSLRKGFADEPSVDGISQDLDRTMRGHRRYP